MEEKKDKKPIRISIDDKGEVTLDQEQLDEEQLSAVAGGIEIIRNVSCKFQKR
jgi:biopolymer transport protein ExbD